MAGSWSRMAGFVVRKRKRVQLHDLGFGNGFLSITQKAQTITTKDKSNLIKIKIFVHQRILSGK